MEHSIDQLTNSFKNFNLTDNRTVPKNDNMDILTNMIGSMNISKDEEIDDLISNIDSMIINDDNVVITLKDNTVIVFYLNQCRTEYNSLHGNTLPRWQDAY